jgi:hypothetical protein
MSNYKDLILSQKSDELSFYIYEATEKLPKAEIFGLTSGQKWPFPFRLVFELYSGFPSGRNSHDRGLVNALSYSTEWPHYRSEKTWNTHTYKEQPAMS